MSLKFSMERDDPSTSITLRDIARAVGVSRTTVSNAFNRPDQLSTELRGRVLTAAKQMGYLGPNPMARMLRTGHTGAIGLVFADTLPYAFSDPTAIAFLQGVAEVCERTRASLLILPTQQTDTTTESEAAKETIRQAAVDGFLIYSMPSGSEAVAQVLARQLPVVAIDQTNLQGIPSVSIDDRCAAYDAAAHLLNFNHRELAILALEFQPDLRSGAADAQRIAQATFPVSRLRMQGYTDAVREAGLNPDRIPVEEVLFNSEAGAYEASLTLLRRSPRPTGILAMSDRLALGALRAAEQLGLSIPEDLSIVGFDDTPLATQIRPQLTTVRQPLIEKGKMAAELLLGQLKNRRSIVLETQLVVRDSSAVAPVQIN